MTELETQLLSALEQRHEYEVPQVHRQKELVKEREYPGPSLEL